MTRLFLTAIVFAAFALPSIASAADVAAGNAKFQALCVSCHGPSGKGDGPTGKALAAAGQPAPRDFTIGDFKLDTDKDGTVTVAELSERMKETRSGKRRHGGSNR